MHEHHQLSVAHQQALPCVRDCRRSAIRIPPVYAAFAAGKLYLHVQATARRHLQHARQEWVVGGGEQVKQGVAGRRAKGRDGRRPEQVGERDAEQGTRLGRCVDNARGLPCGDRHEGSRTQGRCVLWFGSRDRAGRRWCRIGSGGNRARGSECAQRWQRIARHSHIALNADLSPTGVRVRRGHSRGWCNGRNVARVGRRLASRR